MNPRTKKILQLNNISDGASLLYEDRDPSRTTDRYSEIDHLAVVELLNYNDWLIQEYVQIKPQKPERRQFVQWMAVYRNPNFKPLGEFLAPIIVQEGSHDGSTPLELSFGIKDLKTNSVLISGDNTCPEFRFKHKGKVPSVNELEVAIRKALVDAGQVQLDYQKIANTELSAEALINYAKECAALRFDPKKYTVNVYDLVRQDTLNLWEQFIHIQKTLLKAKNLRVFLNKQQKHRKMKALHHINASMKLKKDLWNLTMDFTCNS